MEQMEELRRRIDEIDGKLVELLTARMTISGQMAQYKKTVDGCVLVPDRERALLNRVEELTEPELRAPIQSVYKSILSASRAIQKQQGCGRFGLVGERLNYSFSPAIHKKLGGYSYQLFERKAEEVEPFLRKGAFDGLNITIPYKKTVMKFCDALTEQARRIGSVNTIVRQPDGTLLGHNTDYDGFCYLIRSAGAEVQGKKVLVLGSGGSSLTVQTVLRDMGAGEVVVISRSGPNHYGNLSRHRDAAILVNTTPVGTYPDTGRSPVNLDLFPDLEWVFDLIYNPAMTQLLLDAEKRQIGRMGGLGMLVAQAKAAAELFLERPLPDSMVEQIVAQMEWESKNLLLIGMPGCGKSTVGRALARRLNRPFIDLDEMVEERAGTSIPSMFEREGEEHFRQLEHQVLTEVGKGSGAVIATGGGIVTRPENWCPMRQNSTVIFLRRPLNELSAAGRPLSQRDGVKKLYQARLPLYEQAAQLTVENETVEGTVSEIIRRLKK